MIALLSIATVPSDDGKSLIIQVAILQADSTTTVYTGRHAVRSDSGCVVQLPEGLIVPRKQCDHAFRPTCVGSRHYHCIYCDATCERG